jgi:hypothetical protein
MMAPTTVSETGQVAGNAASPRSAYQAAYRAAHDQATTSGALLALFILSLVLPIRITVATLLMNPSRLFLLLVGIPFAIKLLRGKLGGITWVDACVLGFVTLMPVTLVYNHGTGQLGYGLSQIIEMFGGYVTGRVLIRSVPDYRRMIRFLLVALLVLLPFAVDEMLHFRMIITDTLSRVVGVIPKTDMTLFGRFGMRRVQSVFPHSILFGLFCSMVLGSVFYLYRDHPGRRIAYLALVISMTLMALSSAPMLSIVLQLGLIAWGIATRGSWKVLLGLMAFMFVFLEIFSNRGPFILFIETMTFDPATGWWRIFIWEYGIQNVLGSPIFGIGLNDWVRPSWMYSSSVDNFWLLMALRYGLPCVLFVLLAFLLHLVFLVRAKNLSEDARMLRLGYMITLCALIFLLVTVDVWDAVAVFVFFFLGAGAFLYTSDQSDATGAAKAEPAPDRPAGSMFSRFPQTEGTGRRQSPQSPQSPQTARTGLG